MEMSPPMSLQAYQGWYKYPNFCQGRIQVCQWMWKSQILEQMSMLQAQMKLSLKQQTKVLIIHVGGV